MVLAFYLGVLSGRFALAFFGSRPKTAQPLTILTCSSRACSSRACLGLVYSQAVPHKDLVNCPRGNIAIFSLGDNLVSQGHSDPEPSKF